MSEADQTHKEWPRSRRGYFKLVVSREQADRFISVLGMEEDDFIIQGYMPTMDATDEH